MKLYPVQPLQICTDLCCFAAAKNQITCIQITHATVYETVEFFLKIDAGCFWLASLGPKIGGPKSLLVRIFCCCTNLSPAARQHDFAQKNENQTFIIVPNVPFVMLDGFLTQKNYCFSLGKIHQKKN
jgi:hypothetical protein